MAIRDILVHLDTTPRLKVRLDLAARYRAYLIGLSVTNGSVPASNGQTGAEMMEQGFRGWLANTTSPVGTIMVPNFSFILLIS